MKHLEYSVFIYIHRKSISIQNWKFSEESRAGGERTSAGDGVGRGVRALSRSFCRLKKLHLLLRSSFFFLSFFLSDFHPPHAISLPDRLYIVVNILRVCAVFIFEAKGGGLWVGQVHTLRHGLGEDGR